MRSQISSSGGCRALDRRDMAGAGAAAPTVQPTALLLHCSPAEGSRTTAQEPQSCGNLIPGIITALLSLAQHLGLPAGNKAGMISADS